MLALDLSFVEPAWRALCFLALHLVCCSENQIQTIAIKILYDDMRV